ncbi:MAG: rRNA pseudouridine synthase [Lachnospiraceae bacterium]|nr:rRNA pseudouridine synthase [Lachnospiraceae bacterium]
MSLIRLDKMLANAGIGSRTQVKDYIKKGLISVNGETASKPELKVDPDKDSVALNGESINTSSTEYYILNKPAGYVSATKDNVHSDVISLIDSTRKDLFPVGRLDKDTEGLLLITNDGTLAHNMLSPKKHVDKTYYAVIEGIVNKEDIHIFAEGVNIGDDDLNVALPAKLAILDEPLSSYYNMVSSKSDKNNTDTTETEKNTIEFNWDSCSISYITVTITEGKFHQVKRMFHAIGKEVLYLRRISFGPLKLPSDLAIGESRKLTTEELELLSPYM